VVFFAVVTLRPQNDGKLLVTGGDSRAKSHALAADEELTALPQRLYSFTTAVFPGTDKERRARERDESPKEGRKEKGRNVTRASLGEY